MTTAAALDIIARHARGLRLWVLECVAWLAALMDWRAGRIFLREELRALRAQVRLTLVARAALEIHAGRIPRNRHRSSARIKTDVPRYTKRHMRRFVLRGVSLHAVQDVSYILDHLETVAQHCICNLRDGIAERFMHDRSVDELVRALCASYGADAPDTS